MLTWSEALTALKSGADVRRKGWPRTRFLRASPTQQIRLYVVTATLTTTVTAYTLSDEDQFAADWTHA